MLTANLADDEFANASPRTFIEINGCLSLISQAFSYITIPKPAFSIVIPAPSTFVSRYIDKDLQRVRKLALKLFIKSQKQVIQAVSKQDTNS